MNEEIIKSKAYRIIFMGTPDFAVPALSALVEAGFNIVAVISQPNKPQGRNQIIKPTPVAKFAEQKGLKLLQPKSINVEEVIADVKQLKPDLIITAAFGQILKKAVLDLPKYGCINIHASLLPLYRGAAPINAAVIDGQSETGITIMQMDEGCDTGDILFQEKIEIASDDTAGSLFNALADLGGSTIVNFLPKFFAGKIKPIVQSEAGVTYAPKMTRETGKINWNKTATEIDALIRGTQPWPGCYTYLGNERMKVFAADIIKQEVSEGVPGELLSCHGGLKVQCGEDAILLKEIQFASGRPMSADLCSHNYDPGIVLGKEV